MHGEKKQLDARVGAGLRAELTVWPDALSKASAQLVVVVVFDLGWSSLEVVVFVDFTTR